ncbi:MAG: hydrogenase 3 maturation endopeptidase HyCI [Candidatus Binatia bacterium]
MENILQPLLRGRVVIVGIGNPLRGDDGFGPALIAHIQGKVPMFCIDAGNAPENYIGRIVREQPDTILLVDVAHLDLAPGQYCILRPADIAKSGFSTHDISSRMLIEFLENEVRANILLLGVQPQDVSLGEGMSAQVLKTLDEIERFLLEVGECTRPI